MGPDTVRRRARQWPSRRWGVRAGLLGAVVLGVAVLVEYSGTRLPDVGAIQRWAVEARQLGPALPLVFVLAHAVFTMVPFPRTVFTLAAGVLFGPALGIPMALAGATLSAVAALVAVRALGRERVAARLQHPALRGVDARLAQRGWLAVASLRLIPVVPFWLVNYACGVSAVRVVPFTVATLVATVPGTTAVVLLGDAVTGRSSPWLLAVSATTAAVGVLGITLEARRSVKPQKLLW